MDLRFMKTKDTTLLEEAYLNIHEAKKTYEVSLDRPGAGWKKIVRANSPEEAKRIANKNHPHDPADGVYEIQPEQAEQEEKPVTKTPGAASKAISDPEAFVEEFMERLKNNNRSRGLNYYPLLDSARGILQKMIERL